MYVSELFVHGEGIIDALAGPWKKRGFGWGRFKEQQRRFKTAQKRRNPSGTALANERRTRRISFNVNNPKNRIEIRGFAAEAKCDKLQ